MPLVANKKQLQEFNISGKKVVFFYKLATSKGYAGQKSDNNLNF